MRQFSAITMASTIPHSRNAGTETTTYRLCLPRFAIFILHPLNELTLVIHTGHGIYGLSSS
jgi:hypothetical protein